MSVINPHIEFVPVQSAQPVSLKFAYNEKQYEIVQWQRRVGGEWVTMDLSLLSDQEKTSLAHAAGKTAALFEQLPQDLKNAHTFTLHFHQEPEISGGLFQRAVKTPTLLQEITYQTAEGGETQTYKVNTEEQQALLKKTSHLAKAMKVISKEREKPVKIGSKADNEEPQNNAPKRPQPEESEEEEQELQRHSKASTSNIPLIEELE